jgi:hypothetical protein
MLPLDEFINVVFTPYAVVIAGAVVAITLLIGILAFNLMTLEESHV